MPVRVVLWTALVVVATLLVVVLAGGEVERVGTNRVSPHAFHVEVPPGRSVCQPGTPLPSGTGRVQILIGTYGRPLPTLSLRFVDEHGRVLASGRLRGGGSEGDVAIPLERETARDSAGTMCIANRGHATVVVGSDVATPESAARLGDVPTPGRIAAVFLAPSGSSWWAALPDIAHRFGLGKAAVFGTWTLPVVVLLLAITWGLALGLLAWETRR